MKLTSAIERTGYGFGGDIGGLPRTTYYTPDGRVIKAIPSIREYVKKDKEGKVIGGGTRDANLDKGWLLSLPNRNVRKLFCQTCDRWHDTQAEVKACGQELKKFIDQMTRKAKKENTDKTSSLEQQVAELKAMVSRLMEGKNGGILQPKANELKKVSRQQRARKGKEAV